MNWKNHPFMNSTLGEKAKEYERELKKRRLYGTGRARDRFYNHEDYNRCDDNWLIWDTACWLLCLQWLFTQDENLDMESLYEFFDGTPEQISYCKDDIYGGSRQQWHDWLDDMIHFFIYEEQA